MATNSIVSEGNIPVHSAAPKPEREVVGLAQIRLTVSQFFIALATVCAFFIAVGVTIGKLNEVSDELNRFEKYTDIRFDKIDTRFDKIDATLESIQIELHQQNLDIAQTKQQMVDSKR